MPQDISKNLSLTIANTFSWSWLKLSKRITMCTLQVFQETLLDIVKTVSSFFYTPKYVILAIYENTEKGFIPA